MNHEQNKQQLIRRFERILPGLERLALAFPGTFHERDYLVVAAQLDMLRKMVKSEKRVA
jgi:hypothetical protein